MMKKVVFELNTKSEFKHAQRTFFDKIESIEGLAIFRLDFLRGYVIMLTEYNMREGYSLDDAELPPEAQILTILDNFENKYTCLMKLKPYSELDSIIKKFDLNVVWTTPLKVTEDKRVYSAITDQNNLKKLISVIQLIGDIERISVQKATFEAYGVLSCLTARQKDVLIEAKKMGYYCYPRKVNGEAVGNALGISKAATIEHLRKAEARIMSQILAGYG
jgi:predicted DNA binding protein